MSGRSHDLAIVGGGIVGLAHALAATRIGLKVVLFDRDTRANGASVRNFGFVTVTGQARGDVWRLARRSRDIWLEVANEAGIAIEQRGLAVVVRRPEARAVIEAFLDTEMATGCSWLDRPAASRRLGCVHPTAFEGALFSETDIRVDSRRAVPTLAAWLQTRHHVEIRRGVAVRDIAPGRLETSEGPIRTGAVVVCPGDDLKTLFPEVFAEARVTRCKLQMMRLAAPGYRLPATLMSDLSLIRYLGYAALPEAEALRRRLVAEQPGHLAHGVHLIVAQEADGSLVVGDSHDYADTPDPFASDAIDRLILDEADAVLGAVPPVIERWTGTYASADRHGLVAAPMAEVRLVSVTSGTGASTAFALAENVIGDLFDSNLGVAP